MAGSVDSRLGRRRRPLTVIGLGLLAIVFFGFGWLDRGDDAALSFEDRRRIMIVSDAGPVTITSGDENRASHTDSFLIRRPTIELATDDDEAIFRIRCETAWPCRSTTEVEVKPGVELVVIATGGIVQVNSFSGDLTIFSEHDDVYLGPVSGSARVVSATGDVAGFGLELEALPVEVDHSDIDLDFVESPRTVVLTNDEGTVDLDLPDTGYDLSVRTADELADQVEIGVGADSSTGATVSIRSGGAVTVSPGEEPNQ